MANRASSSKVKSSIANDDTVRARINRRIKQEATKVLKEIGLTPSSAYRMMMIRIAKDKALPFDPHMPNEKTQAALRAAEKGQVTKFAKLDDLFDDLNA